MCRTQQITKKAVHPLRTKNDYINAVFFHGDAIRSFKMSPAQV